MRFGIGLAALVALAGCAPEATGTDARGSAASRPGDTSAIGTDFDYRYAYRVPASRIGQLQDSHVRGCDQLGPARCKVTTVRYHVGDDNMVTAVLTLQIDPAIARAYGRAATEATKAAGGLLIDAQTAGTNGAQGAARASGIVARLRDESSNIDALLRGTPTDEQRAAAIAKQGRIRAAIATIAEVDQNATQSIATTPMLITYASGNVAPSLGGSAGATFDNAGQTFIQSLASLAQIMAGIAPWLLLLLGGALLLRRFINPDEAPPARPVGVPLPHEDTNRNVIQRWFSREPEHDREPETVG